MQIFKHLFLSQHLLDAERFFCSCPISSVFLPSLSGLIPCFMRDHSFHSVACIPISSVWIQGTDGTVHVIDSPAENMAEQKEAVLYLFSRFTSVIFFQSV